MTIEVIKPSPGKFEATCRVCACVFSYTTTDFVYRFSGHTPYEVKCPTCGDLHLHPNQAERQR